MLRMGSTSNSTLEKLLFFHMLSGSLFLYGLRFLENGSLKSVSRVRTQEQDTLGGVTNHISPKQSSFIYYVKLKDILT